MCVAPIFLRKRNYLRKKSRKLLSTRLTCSVKLQIYHDVVHYLYCAQILNSQQYNTLFSSHTNKQYSITRSPIDLSFKESFGGVRILLGNSASYNVGGGGWEGLSEMDVVLPPSFETRGPQIKRVIERTSEKGES